ncbi:MAG: carboxypeptidase-like regulatory domain-containing protein, partial [Candidatus Hodarchaeota archaeon]
GKESEFQSAFYQIDNVTFNYKIDTALNDEVQEVAGEVTFITKDVDGRIVPNAEVTITEDYGTPTEVGPYETTEEDGSTHFSNVAYGLYNVTVNYTIPYSGIEAVVYNSSLIPEEFLIDGSGKVYELTLNMCTIDFEIVDYGGYPLTYGYINVSYNEGGTALDILQLENDGKATFRWLNRSFYYYQIYYNNIDFSPNPTPINASYIWRDDYAKYPDGTKHQFHTFDINKENQASPSGYFNVKERIYTNWSTTEISDIKLLNVTISIQNNEFLKNVSVYYIDSSDNTDTLSHRILFDDSYVGETSEKISIDLMTVVNSKLSTEYRLAYGLLIDVWGVNSSICTGDIKINMTEAWHVYNKTDISILNIRVLGDGNTISDAIVSIKSNSTIYGQIVNTTLKSDKDRNSYSFSYINDLPFIYLRGYYYNFSVAWGEGASLRNTFNVSGPDPDQWAPIIDVPWYNYSLLKYNFTLEFDIDMGAIDPSTYKIKFDDITAPDDVIWGKNVTIQVHFNKTEDDWGTWDNVTSPDDISLTIKRAEVVLFTFAMNPTGMDGYWMKEFNSSILSAGLSGLFYKIVITGSKSPYILQGDEIFTLFVDGKSTILTLHDYYSPILEEITDNTISQRFGELVNITVQFYNDSNNPLMDAEIAFEWLNLGYNYTGFQPDPLNPGYFTLTLDT